MARVESTEDVIEFLTAQHNLIKDSFDEVLHASGDEAREKAFVDLRRLLAVHETAEEMVVHPRARAAGPAGDDVVDARLREEHEAKEQLAAIERMDLASQDFIDALIKLREAVADHAELEENEEFVTLAGHLGTEELERMVRAVHAAERIAPTRPHPGVESALANYAVGPFVSMLDRARDALQAALR